MTSSSQDGGDLQVVSNDWDEATITWSTAPALPGVVFDGAGRTATGSWVELDVSNAIRGNGTYSFALVSKASSLGAYSSREGEHPPQLVLVP